MTDPSLKTQITDEMKAAMKSGDKVRLGALRMFLAAIKTKEVEGATARELSDDEIRQVAAKEVKKRSESIEAFQSAGRDEQAAKEQAELEVLEEFMPEPLTEDELERIVDDAIAEVGATSMRELGRVMADVMPQIAGRADGSVVSQLVREKLA